MNVITKYPSRVPPTVPSCRLTTSGVEPSSRSRPSQQARRLLPEIRSVRSSPPPAPYAGPVSATSDALDNHHSDRYGEDDPEDDHQKILRQRRTLAQNGLDSYRISLWYRWQPMQWGDRAKFGCRARHDVPLLRRRHIPKDRNNARRRQSKFAQQNRSKEPAGCRRYKGTRPSCS